MYRIDDIDFQLSPSSKFQLRGGDETTYAEYYSKKYNRSLNEPRQPLIIHKKKKDGVPIHLMPELCVLTGQSNEMRQNFQLQKDLNRIIKPNPQKRLEESRHLLELLYQNTNTSELMKKWGINIDLSPLKMEATKINAGDLIMGNNNMFSVENTPDFDRKIQVQMLEQPKLSKIGVFCSSRDRDACKTFMDTLEKCVDTFKYPMAQPKDFYVDGRDFADWENQFRSVLNSSVDAVILLLPGKKKSSPFYDECKHFLLTQFPIPSQVVLVSTILAGKNLRSIINKVLIQICAKVGGTPWSLTEFPFTDKPTMVVGIDVFHRANMKKDSLVAYCATMNRQLSRYWSTVDVHNSEEVAVSIQTAVKKSLLEFRATNNGFFPQVIIVYRDGVSDSQRKTLRETEVGAFLRAFDELQSEGLTEKPRFLFVCVNKKMTAKFFNGDNLQRDSNLSNPEQGTVIDSEVTSGNDFYLISQKTTQGSATPTHYFVLSCWAPKDGQYVEEPPDQIPEDVFKKLQGLTYKLCYMYYNWSGSIKVPAPIQYAAKLSNLIGDRWNPRNPMIPHQQYETYKSLYFI